MHVTFVAQWQALIGCRTEQEVDQLLDDHLSPALGPEFWLEFEKEFGTDVATFPQSGHWYYNKEASDIGN